MAVAPLIFQSGFDVYTEALTEWSADIGNGQHAVAAPGRFGYGQRLVMAPDGSGHGQSALVKYFPAAPYKRIVVGVAMQVSNTGFNPQGTFPIMLFQGSNGVPFAAVALNSLGRISIVNGLTVDYDYSGGTVLASSGTLKYPLGAWFYIETDWTFDGTNSTCIVRINGQEIVRATGFGTAAECYGIGLPGYTGQGGFYYDDLYVLGETDAQVSAPGDSFLGDVKVVPLLPSADGHLTQFTPIGNASGVTTHFTTVNDPTPNNDTNYVESNVVGAIDTYRVPTPESITPVTSIVGVSVYALAEKDDSPARFLSCGVSNGTTDNFDAGTALGSAYSYVQRVLPINPLTGVAWTIADFDTLQIGIKVIS